MTLGHNLYATIKMVTSNKLPDKKVVKMAEQNSGVVVPQRTLLGEVNEHITCPLCSGYYIDATTIVECLHSFCRSCIIKHLQVKSYCPVCGMMINSAKPNIKLDKALQDIVYKLVPGLFQKEMERRQVFYSSRPGPAATATPEQRGEDTERIIFSPEDVISFSLEYADATDTDSISSKSSDSNEPQPVSAASRRYLQCPAVVNISHLKKFLSMKFDIDSAQFAIDILYKRVSLPDYYTLMDIAYIYNWKRNEPMRFFYQIIDYVSIRNRLFDINRKGAHFRDRKASPTTTEDTNVSSPAPNVNDQGSEASGTDSPMPDDNNSKQISNVANNNEKSGMQSKVSSEQDNTKQNNPSSSMSNKNIEDVEKSQFLISFELTAKNNTTPPKSSPVKSNSPNDNISDALSDKLTDPPKLEDSLKRKPQTPLNMPEMKKIKIEIEKAKIPESSSCTQSTQPIKKEDSSGKVKENEKHAETPCQSLKVPSSTLPTVTSDLKPQTTTPKPQSPGTRRPPATHPTASPKRKTNNEINSLIQMPTPLQKTVSPLKLQIPKSEAQSSAPQASELFKHTAKKIPDLKPGIPSPHSSLNKVQSTNKIRMDLLANNSDPTIDRSKILSQVTSSLGIPNPGQNSGDPLKTLFDNCKINIPSSLSITLTDQKQDPRNPGETSNAEQKKSAVNKNLSGANSNIAHKVPSPPVHNSIQITKLPDTDTKKQNKPDGNVDSKTPTPMKTETASSLPKPAKSTETSAKGPVPNLKPIADTKLAKQSGNFVSPITFQQSFEQQLLQSDKKPKLPKNKAQVPKLMPATPKAFSVANKINNPNIKLSSSVVMASLESKPSTALDLTTPSNPLQSQLSPHQTKAFETMQSIANLAKKQNLQSKLPPTAMCQSFSNVPNRPLNTGAPLRLPSVASVSQIKSDKTNVSGLISNAIRHEMPGKTKPTPNQNSTLLPSSYQIPSHSSTSAAQPSPRSQTRSPSSSPKLVIAEDKSSSNSELNVNQSNQISSTQLSSMNAAKIDASKAAPGPSKHGPKPIKPMPSASKIGGTRQAMMPTIKPNPPPTDFQLLSAHHAMLKHQMEMNWLKARQYIAHAQAQNEYNKEKQ